METKDNRYYQDVYFINEISKDMVRQNNIIEFIKLLEYKIALYEKNQVPPSIKHTYLVDLTITVASILEAFLSEALKTVESIIHQINGNTDFKFENIYTYEQMIDQSLAIKLLNLEPNLLHRLRNLRNNIHIQRLNFPIHKDRRYSADLLHQSIDLVYLVASNLATNIKQMRG